LDWRPPSLWVPFFPPVELACSASGYYAAIKILEKYVDKRASSHTHELQSFFLSPSIAMTSYNFFAILSTYLLSPPEKNLESRSLFHFRSSRHQPVYFRLLCLRLLQHGSYQQQRQNLPPYFDYYYLCESCPEFDLDDALACTNVETSRGKSLNLPCNCQRRVISACILTHTCCTALTQQILV
jgi:hypothetical protein